MTELPMGDIEEINVILPSGRYSTATRRADIKILASTGYSAASRVITTTNDLIDQLLVLGR